MKTTRDCDLFRNLEKKVLSVPISLSDDSSSSRLKIFATKENNGKMLWVVRIVIDGMQKALLTSAGKYRLIEHFPTPGLEYPLSVHLSHLNHCVSS